MMWWRGCVLGFTYLLAIVKTQKYEDRLVDPASRTLQDFLEKHEKPIGLLTTSSGKPVDIRDTDTYTNAELLTNAYFMDNIQHLVNEKIPERVVNPKGIGAYGYFEVINNVTKYTKAKFLEYVGKKTPLFVRLASGQIEKGSSDASIFAIRGFSVKIYTEEGNLDFLNIQTPVFMIRSPDLFAVGVHAINRKNTKNNLLDRTSIFDFTILHPQSLHWLLWTASEFGLSKGFRYMNSFPIHTYQLYNQHGEIFYARFKFLAELGYDGLSLQEAANITAIDPDLFIRDLYNSIETKQFPAWRLEMDVLTEQQAIEADFNPFDVISLWPNGKYQTVPIGRIVLNRNVDNHFRETEQSIFNPASLVPGINSPPDSLFKGRAMAYFDAHVNRVGINHNKIEINCPFYSNTYNRDGLPPVLDNMKDAPTYYPNSFNGAVPYVDESRPASGIIPLEDDNIDFTQPRYFYNTILQRASQKQRLIDGLVDQIIRVVNPIQQKFTNLLALVDIELARRFNESLALAKETKTLPALINDFNRDEL